jgi:hypothetical protein
MLEDAVTELFEQQAAESPPPTRASVIEAARRGRSRRRRRQAAIAASPVLAAGAVLAIALGGIIPTGAYPPNAAPTVPAASAAQAPRLFSPLRPYASPGWLPGGQSVSRFVAGFSRLEDQYAGPGGVGLTVYARGVCRLSSRSFTCGWPHDPVAPGLTLPRTDIGRRTGDLSGRAAYWAFPQGNGIGVLTWQYAAGGWARVQARALQYALRMARSVRFGTAAGLSAAFPFQLTGVPADWRVNSVFTQVDHGVRYAFSFSVTAGPVNTILGVIAPPRQVVMVQTGPEYGTSCESYFRHASYRRQIIDGNETFVLLRPQAWDSGAESGICTVGDGVLASVITDGQSALTAADLLAHHMRFLGPDPADWTTRPIG